MRKLASIQSISKIETQREGIGGRLSFKAINPKFLVKYNL